MTEEEIINVSPPVTAFSGDSPLVRGGLSNGLSFSKQVAVRPGAGQRQDQDSIFHAVDQQPVREDMTFPVAGPIPGKSVVLGFFGERFAHSKGADNIVQETYLPSPLDRR